MENKQEQPAEQPVSPQETQEKGALAGDSQSVAAPDKESWKARYEEAVRTQGKGHLSLLF